MTQALDPTYTICPKCQRAGLADSVCIVCGRHGHPCHRGQKHMFDCQRFRVVRGGDRTETAPATAAINHPE